MGGARGGPRPNAERISGSRKGGKSRRHHNLIANGAVPGPIKGAWLPRRYITMRKPTRLLRNRARKATSISQSPKFPTGEVTRDHSAVGFTIYCFASTAATLRFIDISRNDPVSSNWAMAF